jgi:hypothetical protein
MTSEAPQPPPLKKKTSCLWVSGLGCLSLIAILGVGGYLILPYFPQWKEAFLEYQRNSAANPDKAAAKLTIRLIPQVQILREDDEAKTITFKSGPQGEELTLHYEGIGGGAKKPRLTNSKGQEGSPTGKPIDETNRDKTF